MICKNCVAENSENAKFCTVCGTKLTLDVNTGETVDMEVRVEEVINDKEIDTAQDSINEIADTKVAVEDIITNEAEVVTEEILVEDITNNTGTPNTSQNNQNQYANPIFNNQVNNQNQNNNQNYNQNNNQNYNQNQNFSDQGQYYNQNLPMRKVKPALSQSPYVNLVKQTVSSGVFLTMVILSSVALLISLLTIIFSYGSIGYALQNIMYSFYQDIPDFYKYFSMDFFNGLYYISIISGIIALIPAALNVLGMWLIYASGKAYENRKTSGYTIIKVLSILNLVSCIGVVLLILGILFITIISGFGAGGETIAILLVMAFILALAIIVPVLQNIAIIKIINNTKAVLNNYAPKRISMMLPVLNYILVGCSVVALFSMNFVSVGINMAVLIIGAIIISKYNKDLFQLTHNMNAYNNQNNQNNQMNNMQNNY